MNMVPLLPQYKGHSTEKCLKTNSVCVRSQHIFFHNILLHNDEFSRDLENKKTKDFCLGWRKFLELVSTILKKYLLTLALSQCLLDSVTTYNSLVFACFVSFPHTAMMFSKSCVKPS